MDITSIFKEGLSYPVSNFKNLIIVGVILTVVSLLTSATTYTQNRYLGIIALIIGIILTIILEGYKLDVIGHGIRGDSEISFPNGGNFVNGIKSIIVSFVYFIIPALVVAIVAILTGASAFTKILESGIMSQATISNPDVVNATLSTIPSNVWASFGFSVLITLIVAILLFVVFGIFAEIATGRLAETGSLSDALSIGEINKKVGSIGWGKVIAYIIILAIICAIIGFIATIIVGILALIPYVGVFIGVIIASLIIIPFVYLFQYYSLGLLYSEA